MSDEQDDKLDAAQEQIDDLTGRVTALTTAVEKILEQLEELETAPLDEVGSRIERLKETAAAEL